MVHSPHHGGGVVGQQDGAGALLGPVRHTLHRTSCTGQECRRTGVPGDRGRAASREFKYTPFLGIFFKIAKSYIDLEICFLQFLLLFGHFLDHIEPKYRPTKNGRYTNLAGSPGQGDREAGK